MALKCCSCCCCFGFSAHDLGDWFSPPLEERSAARKHYLGVCVLLHFLAETMVLLIALGWKAGEKMEPKLGACLGIPVAPEVMLFNLGWVLCLLLLFGLAGKLPSTLLDHFGWGCWKNRDYLGYEVVLQANWATFSGFGGRFCWLPAYLCIVSEQPRAIVDEGLWDNVVNLCLGNNNLHFTLERAEAIGMNSVRLSSPFIFAAILLVSVACLSLSFAMGKKPKKTTKTPAHSPPPTTTRKKSTKLVVDDELDVVNTVDVGEELSDEEKGEPSAQSSIGTSIDEEEVARALQISLEQNLEAILTDDVDNAIANEQPLNKEIPPDNVSDTPLEQPTNIEEKEKERAPPDTDKSGDKLNEDKVDKPVDGKKSFASFFKKNRAENKGMELHKVVAPKCFIPEEDMLTVEEIWGPCLAKKEINNKKLLINIPPDDFMWDVKSFSTMPVWVKLWNLPMRFWSPNALSHIGSQLGTPMYTDGLTHTVASKLFDEDQAENDELKYQRPNYCRMLINMDLSLIPPTSVEVDFVGGSYVQKVEYEDMPQYCYHCKCFGHDPFNCSVLHEINKRRFNKEQKSKERARVETLKTIMLTEAQVITGRQHQPQKGKDNGKDDENNTMENKGKEKDTSGGVAHNPNDPGPSFTAHAEDDGFTQVGGGKGKLTTHPIRDGKQRTGYNKGGGQTGGYRGDLSGPWAIMGDFNAVISSTERVNCQTQSAYYMTDLRQFRINNALNDANSSGLKFTWNKGYKWAKLDRVLINDEWENMQWDCWAEFREMEVIFDHCLVVLKLMNIQNQGTRPFKFYNMWLKHDDFDTVIRDNWDQRINGTRQYRLCVKLKKLKQPLRLLNKLHFGHISQRAESARKEYSHLMQKLILEPDNPSLLSKSVEL
ncbi:unnamed protein product [Cuscuta campestris]|uniref:Uncharacterized protein n=1 Tax=Cuscuta campestris TaxID=132261 RepID=A0A484KV18_9ASTE|nr:unnamed protein product [Cuscuta campestris]